MEKLHALQTKIMTVVFFGVGLIILFVGIGMIRGEIEDADWLPATGVVSSVEYWEEDNDDIEAISAGTEPRTWGYEKITFSYTREDGTVGTGTYERWEIHPEDGVRTETGESFEVVYDPYSDTVKKGAGSEIAAYIFGGILCAVGALLIFVFAYGPIDSFIRKFRFDSGKRRKNGK